MRSPPIHIPGLCAGPPSRPFRIPSGWLQSTSNPLHLAARNKHGTNTAYPNSAPQQFDYPRSTRLAQLLMETELEDHLDLEFEDQVCAWLWEEDDACKYESQFASPENCCIAP